MPFVSQEHRRWEYYAESGTYKEPTQEDFVRGQRLAEGLCKLRQSLLNVADEHLDIAWSSLNDARIIVVPKSPIRREVVRADGFYDYTSPNELSESDYPLVIARFKLFKPELTMPDIPLVDAESPSFEGHAGFQIKEVFSALDITAHQIAVSKKE